MTREGRPTSGETKNPKNITWKRNKIIIYDMNLYGVRISSGRQAATQSTSIAHDFFFLAPFLLFFSLVSADLGWRVDCVAVFQWNIFNWKFLNFFVRYRPTHIER